MTSVCSSTGGRDGCLRLALRPSSTRGCSTATLSCRTPSYSGRSTPVPRRAGAKALAQADPGWLVDLITRQVPLDQWEDAYDRKPDDIKAVLTFADA
jgi:hypothetical protein